MTISVVKKPVQQYKEKYFFDEIIKEESAVHCSYKAIHMHSEHYIENIHCDMFDDFLMIELDKLKDLTRMYCESEYSSNCMFGELLMSQLEAFKERLREAAHHIEQTIGNIGVVRTYHKENCFKVGTVIDAGYYDSLSRTVKDSLKS